MKYFRNPSSRLTVLIQLLFVVGFMACGTVPINNIKTENCAIKLGTLSDDDFSSDHFVSELSSMGLEQREEYIYERISSGQIPQFMRGVVPVTFSQIIEDKVYQVTFCVAPEYISVGSSDDYLIMPMTPILAQRIMNLVGGTFPTRKMVDLIWHASEVKLDPLPILPSDSMTSVEVFRDHNGLVSDQRQSSAPDYRPGELISGHKKDVILSNCMADDANKVVIYGWHRPDGDPVQPVYSGHVNWYADYSHGVRIVQSQCLINDVVMNISDVLTDEKFYKLFSDESEPMKVVRYDTSSANYPQD